MEIDFSYMMSTLNIWWLHLIFSFFLSTAIDDHNNQHNSPLLPLKLPTLVISNLGDFFFFMAIIQSK